MKTFLAVEIRKSKSIPDVFHQLQIKQDIFVFSQSLLSIDFIIPLAVTTKGNDKNGYSISILP